MKRVALVTLLVVALAVVACTAPSARYHAARRAGPSNGSAGGCTAY